MPWQLRVLCSLLLLALLQPAGAQTTPAASQQSTKHSAKSTASKTSPAPAAQPAEPAIVPSMDPPSAYHATYIDARFGPSFTTTIDHRGARILVDQGLAGGAHVRSLYDLDKQTRVSWTLPNPEGSCVHSAFSGDWGDPFRTTVFNGMDAHFAGMDRVHGASANIMEDTSASGGTARAWFEAGNNVLLKVEETAPGGKPITVLELTSLQQSAPPDAAFAVPPACASTATPDELRTLLLGKRANDFVPATAPPQTPDTDSCTVHFRVMLGGAFTPLTHGFQAAVDLNVDPSHLPAYQIGVTPEGHATFAGGQLHEVTGEFHDGSLLLEHAPAIFEIDTEFGIGGSAHALIYRQCFGPETTLLLVVRDPTHPSDANAWVWEQTSRGLPRP